MTMTMTVEKKAGMNTGTMTMEGVMEGATKGTAMID